MFEKYGFEKYTQTSLREYLTKVYTGKKINNSSYSLRAFARDLKISPASVSEFMRGKRRFSPQKLKELAQFISTSIVNEDDLSETQKYNPLGFRSLNKTEIVSNIHWYYNVLAELPKIKKFTSQSRWISRALGVSQAKIHEALLTLEKIGWIKKDSVGNWNSVEDNTSTLGNLDLDLRKIVLKVLSETIDLQKKDLLKGVTEKSSHVGVTFAINPNDLPKARSMIYEFVYQMSDYLERANVEKTQVFRMNIGLFPLTKLDEIVETEVRSV